MKNYKEKISELEKRHNLDMIELSRFKYKSGSCLSLRISKNNYYYKRDMKNRFMTNKMFYKIMDMIPEMITKLNIIMEEDR